MLHIFVPHLIYLALNLPLALVAGLTVRANNRRLARSGTEVEQMRGTINSPIWLAIACSGFLPHVCIPILLAKSMKVRGLFIAVALVGGAELLDLLLGTTYWGSIWLL